MSFLRISLFILGIGLMLLSSFWSVKLSKEISKWPSGMVNTYYLLHSENNRFNFEDNWSGKIISNSKTSTISTNLSDSVSDVKKSFVVESISGEPLFNLEQEFKINRYTRHNLPGSSDINGMAYSEFPPHTQKMDYLWWPSTFGSPFNMSYVGQEMIDGLRVYHFQSQNAILDDTKGYEFLPLVPEKYKALSSARVDAYIEPNTGMLIDYSDSGISYYSDETVSRLWDISDWSNSLTKGAVTNNVIIAKKMANTMSLNENIIPFIIFILGFVPMYFSIFVFKKK